MRIRITHLLLAALIGVAGTNVADAVVIVTLDPSDQIVDIGDGFASVNILADIPQADAIRGWGLDLDFGLVGVVSVSNVTIGPSFDAVGAFDGDDLAGLVNFANPAVWGNGVVLATVQFSLDATGITSLLLGDDNPADLTEGFALEPPPAGVFAEVDYQNGSIEVIPEPATIAFLVPVACLLARRRRS